MSTLTIQLMCPDCRKSVLVDSESFVKAIQRLAGAVRRHIEHNPEKRHDKPDAPFTYTFRCDDCTRSQDERIGSR